MPFGHTRRVVIDDTHPSIRFSSKPSWFEQSDLKDNTGNSGKVLNSTLHGTDTNGSFSFPFSGMLFYWYLQFT